MELVEVLLRLRGSRQFQSEVDKSTKGVKKFGTTTEKTGKQTDKSWKAVGKFAANGALLAGASRFLHSTATATEDLAKSTMMLQRTTGMDTKTASEWSTVLKSRGIETQQFNVGMVKLSKTMQDAAGGGKKSIDLFNSLGVSLDDVAKGNTQAVLMQMADGLTRMKNPAMKTAAAQALLGKSGQKLIPVFAKGSEGIKEQMGLADEYGATLSGKTGKSMQEMIQHERELKIAQEGMKIQLGTALLPVMMEFSKQINAAVKFMGPLLKNSAALRIVVLSLTAAFITMKVAQLAAALSTLGLTKALVVEKAQAIGTRIAAIALGIASIAVSAATRAWAVATWLLNVAMRANPIGLAITAVLALSAAIFIAYKKSKTFRNIVNAVWNVIKRLAGFIATQAVAAWRSLWAVLKNTPLVFILRHFRQIVSFVRSMPGKIARAATGMWDGIKDAFKSAINWVISKWNNLSFGMSAKKVAGHTVIPGFHIGTPNIPLLADGGTITRGGTAIVGERGPEMIRLPPAAEVIPTARAAMAGATHTITTQVFLDRRQIAEAVGNYAADRIARR